MNDYWQLTRKDTQAWLQFDQDMRWIDEFDWSNIAQSNPVRTLSGAQVIQQGTKYSGRPITLAGDWVWIRRAQLQTMQDWTTTPELEMMLTHYDGRVFNVTFRLHENAFEATPVVYRTPEEDGDFYTIKINLMTI
ncbi:hypothetical protein [Dichelobacter nodosus]|uniref:Uncharacterized protein n=1 Tax=Dichelobacter nodosus (strain VCS1703A) TaxID=246195 RepID=A5EUZ5_DICNV|nr:hypothetical protein [Dichelobacter nodosus]ABQ13540.1 conserved hypothetical protein [Dichelobacter nodosus VCS1703A]KNZ40127.1 hypothetical protein AKG33_00175 [Dichelobacter nodosus]